jgi:photosystem II stability/assembly factor-like uncharacterized protein
MNTLSRTPFFLFSLVSLTFGATPDVEGQWVQTKGSFGTWTSCLAANGIVIYASGGNGVVLSTDMGASWAGDDSGLTNSNVNALAVSGRNLFAGTNGGVFLSIDSCRSWVAINSGIPSNTAISALVVDGTILFAGTYTGIFRSTDSGASWIAMDSGLEGSVIWSLGISGTNLLAGTRGGIFRSNDSGAIWTPSDSGLVTGGFATFVQMGSFLFAGDEDGSVYRSTNNGVSWTAARVLQTAFQGSTFALAASGSNLFAGIGSDSGVYLSTDNGTTWSSVGTGLSGTAVYALAVSGDNLFAGTEGYGIWRRPLLDFNQSSVAENTPASSATTLRVFPNPASNELQIIGSQPGEVHLFDLMGRERMNAVTDGANTMLDVSHLEAGMYFLREGNESAKVEVER